MLERQGDVVDVVDVVVFFFLQPWSAAMEGRFPVLYLKWCWVGRGSVDEKGKRRCR